MSVYSKIHKKMVKDIQDLENERIIQILKDMTCKYCGKMLSSKKEDIDACCEQSMIDYIIDM